MRFPFFLNLSSSLLSILKSLDKYFCTPLEPNSDLTFELKREHYRLVCAYLLLQYFSKNLGFLATYLSLNTHIEYLVLIVHLYLLHKRKLKWVQTSLIVTCFAPFILFPLDPGELFLAIPIVMIGFCLCILVVSGSFFYTFISYLLNVFFIVYVYRPKLFTYFSEIPGDKSHAQLDAMVGCSLSCSLLVNVCVGVLIRSRRTLIMKVLQQKSVLEVANEELISQNKKLQESLAANETFLFSVSHELRNPLNAVMGYVDLAIMSNTIESTTKRYIENAKISGEMLMSLINNLLDFGKLQNNALEFSPNPTIMCNYLGKVWASVKILIQRKGLAGRFYCDKKIPDALLLDPHRVLQVVFNLVGNASKFTSKGKIEIIISWVKGESNFKPTVEYSSPNICEDSSTQCHFEEFDRWSNESPNHRLPQYTSRWLESLDWKRDYHILDHERSVLPKVQVHSVHDCQEGEGEGEGHLKIEVRDSGCGMTNEEQGKLFQKFSQVGATDQKKLGTGLGLWITKNICVGMGGDVRAYSKVGEGSTFVAYLKCKTFAPIKKAVQVPGVTSISIKKLTAIIVDDARLNQEMNKSFLEKCGVFVSDIVGNGLEAVELFKKRGRGYYDIIFMDLDMPVMDGVLSSQKIREWEAENGWKPTILTIVSGHLNKKDYERILNPSGPIKADYIFSKPFTFAQCSDLIAEIRYRSKGCDSTSILNLQNTNTTYDSKFRTTA